MIVDSLQKCNPLAQRQEEGTCLTSKRNSAHMTHRRALRKLIISSAERLKTVFVQAMFTRTLYKWTIHVPNEDNGAIFIPTIRGE